MPDPRVVLRRMQIADQRWRAAIDDSAFAPPDDGFADRLRAISAAAEGEAQILFDAAATPELRWNSAPATARRLSYELRPGGNRPGTPALWDQLDAAVQALVDAQSGTDFAEIAGQFRAIGRLTAELADAVDRERGRPPEAEARQAG